ncbi:hypothetical protein POUND7_002735 [Theobroma cacao]
MRKVHGLEQVENFFSSISERLKGFQVHVALPNCYAHENSVEKAEVLMQKMREMGFTNIPCYNILLGLYYLLNYSKLDAHMLEMEVNGIRYDRYTFGIRLSAYAAAYDVEGIDKIVEKVETSPQTALEWDTYAAAAQGNDVFDILLKLYADIGEKDEIYRIWNRYKEMGIIYNKGYKTLTSALLKLDQVEGAEKIFEEWHSKKLSYDTRIPKLLIDVYSQKGLLDNQIPKAMEAMKKAISVCLPGAGRKPSKETLAACLKYLEGKGDIE